MRGGGGYPFYFLIKQFFIWDEHQKEYKDNYIIVIPYVDNVLWWAYTREGYKIVAYAKTEQELKEKIEEIEKKAWQPSFFVLQ